MISLPLPHVTELDEMPSEFMSDDLLPGIALRRGLPTGVQLSVPRLLQFKQLMEQEGWPVHVARMCYDRLYAYERIAQAHASTRDDVRDVALQLFHTYHRLDHAESGRFSGALNA